MPDLDSTEWTCARCTVTASWTSPEQHDLPSGWVEQDGATYCLSCRRELADEAGGTEARVELEVSRDPNRADTKIARAARSSVISVRKVRERLGVYPTGPS